MESDATNRLAPHEIAFLRGGRRAAVTVAVLALQARGAVKPGRGGTMRTTGPAHGAGADLPALPHLTKTVHAALYRPAGMRQLLDREPVALALIDLRYELTVAGLLRVFPPGRTRAGRRTLRDLRNRHPLPASGRGLSFDDRLLAVALHGDQALTRLVPRFAGEAGLLGRGGTTERELRQSWGGGGSGGFSCASV
ncbi:TIGR04222 domain-containing membrane protein [Streptomyces sp. NPDC058424]|uniref:TIGR04222 domain-containing membrane protein n=1 Tax=Streptomyces sp. NPDC058424 TaxID=3346491 RepID=UPI003656B4DA